MNIKVFSQKQLEDFINNREFKSTDKFAVIILNQDYVNMNSVPQMVSKIQFYVDDTDDINNQEAFDTIYANSMKRFIEDENVLELDYLIVSCLMGQSRSRGAAAALDFIYNGDDRIHFQLGTPNMLIYRTILEVYEYSNKY